ncbi:MAG: Mrp/NBP35 family ATP-binding protein [Planctomycetaceae bacterium]|nr:Mrp/NBP35 family ATP-binding protein [Planctomycetaceae bacterium]
MSAESAILEKVRGVSEPYVGKTLGELGMVASASESTATISLPTCAYARQAELTAAIQAAVGGPVDVQYKTEIVGKNAGRKIGLNVKNIIAVGSGKGGVGKSTVSASIAYGLKHYGATVGLMDADVYGPSIPHLVGAKGQPEVKQYQTNDGRTIERIQPIEVDGLKLMSMGFMISEDQAVIWRGPMLHKALSQFLQQSEWGELDYLIIDMPPGTGDVALTLSQMVPLSGSVIVCTPQQVALLDAVKAVSMFRTVKIPVLGMVENMTGEIFGRGGAKQKAADLGIPFLGEVEAVSQIRELGDAGKIGDLFAADNLTSNSVLDVCCSVAMQVAADVASAPKMPTLEIL